MNTTKRIPIGTTNQVKPWPYAGVAALIVALIASIGFIAVKADRSNTVDNEIPPTSAVLPLTASDWPATPAIRPLLTYYLVDSPEQAAQADLLESEAQMAAMDSSSLQQRQHHVYQITSAEDEAHTSFVIGTTAYELGVANTWDLQVVDLRNRD